MKTEMKTTGTSALPELRIAEIGSIYCQFCFSSRFLLDPRRETNFFPNVDENSQIPIPEYRTLF